MDLLTGSEMIARGLDESGPSYFNDPLVDVSLVARWNATAIENRVFVVGSGEDTELIASLRSQLEKDGKTVFLYKFCTGSPALCQSTTVGAFLGTARVAVLADTNASAESRFVASEVFAGVRVRTGQSRLFIMAPSDLLAPVLQGGVKMVEAVVDPDKK
jgi:hypothetical protein